VKITPSLMKKRQRRRRPSQSSWPTWHDQHSKCNVSVHQGNPEKYCPKSDGKSCNFNINSCDADCRDSNKFFIAVFFSYQVLRTSNTPLLRVKTVTDCADKCVRTPDASIVTRGTFGGVCRCLYDAGMLNTKTIVPTPTKGENVPSMISPQKKTSSFALCDNGDGGRIDIIRWHSPSKGRILSSSSHK
jgi:hypothetical protein